MNFKENEKINPEQKENEKEQSPAPESVTEYEVPRTAMVFEESENAEAESDIENIAKPVEGGDDNADIFALANVSEQDTQVNEADEAKPASYEGDNSGDEFIIPEVFDIAESAEQQTNVNDYVSTIWKTYVPRFTDVTENKYHFADNSALKENQEKSSKAPAASGEGDEDLSRRTSSGIKVEQRRVGTDSDMSDPTAEIESAVPDVVVVNINAKVNTGKKDKINVFKFSEAAKDEQTENISEEERERREISGLTGHNWDEPEKATADEQTDTVSAPEEKKADAASEPYYPYEPASVGSDDSDDPFAEADSAPSKKTYVPEGYEASGKNAANDTTEYNSFSMRDVFKDKFLDSIMAVRIRLVVAIALGAINLAFDIFKDAILLSLGLVASPVLAAIVDACMIVAFLLISLPETVKALKSVILGKVIPELSVFMMGISLLAYNIVIAVTVDVGGYPLFGCVYAITVINAIYATDCLHRANFNAFKLVSEKGNKQIIDKPFTRDLELENAALDGAVDEYKSKIANLYTTPFVSGFFANSAKDAENSRNNLIILCSSFGVAVVIAVIMYFLGGLTAALAAFALAVSLAVPAFSVLTHKVIYEDVQNDAGSMRSAVVGEAALSDYAGVDVVCFEDTEVFGPDDVSLKSASDRRSDYLDSMRKMASLFAALGGPLCEVFESALNKKYTPARNVVIEDDGVEGTVEGKSVMSGNRDYMLRHGVRIPNVNDSRVGSTRVIYAASEGEFFANFTVHYSFSEEFAYTLSEMRDNGMVPLVYTRDFNINNELMGLLTGGTDVIRVKREYEPKSERPVFGKLNASMVTFGDKTTALSLLLTSKKYYRFKDVISVIELASCLTGAALAAAIALCNMMFALPVALLAVWQVGWSIALRIMSKKNFNPRKKDKKNAEQ